MKRILANQIGHAAIAASLTIAGVAGIQLANPGAASARCAGVNHPVTSILYTGDTHVAAAWEATSAGACNNDGTYTTSLGAADGWYPRLYSQNGGVWVLRASGRGGVGWKSASHQSQEFMCAVHIISGNAWCGFGSSLWFEPAPGVPQDLDVLDPSTGLLSWGF